MKTKGRKSIAALTVLGLVVRFAQMALAQTITDNFSDPSNWGTPANAPGKSMTVENGRMNYTSSTTTNGGAAIPRNAPLLPVTQDWSLKVDVHLDAFALTTEEQFSDVFLGVGKTGDWFDNHVTFEFGRGWWGSHNGYYIGDDVRINGDDAPDLFNAYNLNLSASESALRMDYSAANRTITYYFDADGPTGGYNWVAQGTANLASGPYNLNMDPTNTFTVFLLGSSEHQTVSTGQAYLSNLEITVAPHALPSPTITDQPISTNSTIGSTVTFNVTATGSAPLAYQWFKGGVPLSNSSRLKGVQGATLSISNTAISDAGQYSVAVSNSFGVTNSVLVSLLVQNWRVLATHTNQDEISRRVAVSEDLAFIANGYVYSHYTTNTGLRIVNVSNPTNPVRMGDLRIGYSEVNSVALAGARAYVALGTSIPMGLGVVDVSRPTQPSLLQAFDTTAKAMAGTDVAVSGNITYATIGNTLQIFDTSNPNMLVRLGGWTNTYGNWRVVLSGTIAYVAGSGLNLIDVEHPANPVRIGGVSPGSISSVALRGNYAYTVGGQDLRVYDVTNPSNVLWLTSISLSSPLDITIAGNTAYVACNSNGIAMVDISNPTMPSSIARIMTKGEAKSVAVVGNLAYVADGSAGLTIISLGSNSAPAILDHPLGQSVSQGGAVVFSVTANGSAPLRYQWCLTNTPIVGATNSMLWLTNVQSSQSGGYSVIVSNAYGTVTSSVADFTVQIPTPTIRTTDGGFGLFGGQFGFNITGSSNLVIVVEACTNLAAPVWVPLQNCTLTNGAIYFSDPQWTNYPGRFYRLRSP